MPNLDSGTEDESDHDTDNEEDKDNESTNSNQNASMASVDQMSTSSVSSTEPMGESDTSLEKQSRKAKKSNSAPEKDIFLATTCLMPEDPTANVVINTTNKTIKKKIQGTDKVFEIAPGENKVPNNYLRDHKLEVLAFPHLFPNGRNHLHDQRPIRLTPHKYFPQRILNKNTAFAKNADYIFVAQQIIERHDIERQIDIAMKSGKISDTDGGLKMVTDNNCWEIFKKIPNTPTYWRVFRNEIFARMEQLGPFHLFFTLSCGESRWPEVFIAILLQNKKKVRYTSANWDGSEDTVEILDVPKKKDDEQGEDVIETWIPFSEYRKKYIPNVSEFLKENYVLVTRIFDARVKNFVKNILMNQEVAYYAYRIEFQMRGMPHVHGVLWLKDSEVDGLLDDRKHFDFNNKKTEDQMISFIEKWTTCSLPKDDPELLEKVKGVNSHDHKERYCKKKGTFCRFNFPRLPSKKTIIAKPNPFDLEEEEFKNEKEMATMVLGLVKQALIDLQKQEVSPEEDEDLDAFIQKAAGVEYDEYEKYLHYSERGNVIVLKRSINERMVNNYHPLFLTAWNANIDIQICIDGYAILTYITDYFSKSDTGMTQELKKAIKDSKGMGQFERINYVKKVYFTSKQVCVAEAAYKIIPAMPLKKANIASLFLQTGFPDNRTVVAKKYKENDENEEQDQEGLEAAEEEIEDVFTIEGREGLFTRPRSTYEKYAMRPTEPHVVDLMCPAEFFISYLTL